jgi:hypothetical protein
MSTRNARLLLLLLTSALAWGVFPRHGAAADHRESAATQADRAADITDLYVWHNRQLGTLTAAIGIDGLRDPEAGQIGTYDDDVLVTLHIDQDPASGDHEPEIEVRIRFGRSDSGAWGVKVENLPGADGVVVGSVEQVLRSGTRAKVFAGLRDDPFFFDLAGFQQTLASGTLSFTREDSFAGKNVTAIILDMDLAAARGAGTVLDVWATTARK